MRAPQRELGRGYARVWLLGRTEQTMSRPLVAGKEKILSRGRKDSSQFHHKGMTACFQNLEKMRSICRAQERTPVGGILSIANDLYGGKSVKGGEKLKGIRRS